MSYSYTISLYPAYQEEQYITRMTPTGFINVQYESICGANSSFQVHFFNIYFRQLIFNIDCAKNIEEIYDSEDGFSSNFHKVVIIQVIQNIVYEMLIGGRKPVYTNSFFEMTNIRKDMSNDTS